LSQEEEDEIRGKFRRKATEPGRIVENEKKALRAKAVAGQLEIEALEDEAKKWLRAIPSGELHLEDGRVYIQEIKMKPKLTKSIVLEAFSTVLSMKVPLKEGQMMMSPLGENIRSKEQHRPIL
jgi:hypothetical protein